MKDGDTHGSLRLAAGAPRRPEGLAAARGGKPEDMKIVAEIRPKLEAPFERSGYFHFCRIAARTRGEGAWAGENLEGFRSRVNRGGRVSKAPAAGDTV